MTCELATRWRLVGDFAFLPRSARHDPPQEMQQRAVLYADLILAEQLIRFLPILMAFVKRETSVLALFKGPEVPY